jgi:hypothetical protein
MLSTMNDQLSLRHVEIRHFAVQEWRQHGDIEPKNIPKSIKSSDAATKGLSWTIASSPCPSCHWTSSPPMLQMEQWALHWWYYRVRKIHAVRTYVHRLSVAVAGNLLTAYVLHSYIRRLTTHFAQAKNPVLDCCGSLVITVHSRLSRCAAGARAP